MRIMIIMLTLWGLPSGVRSLNDGDRIVGGTAAGENEFPWYARMEFNLDGNTCGGSLISEDIILTAAHCVYNGEDLSPAIFVNIGKTSDAFSSNGDTAVVCETYPHPDYNSATFENDIALLGLCFNKSNEQVRLNSNPDYPSTNGQVLTAIGMGKTCTDCESSDELLKVDLAFEDDATCSVAIFGSPSKFVCVDDPSGFSSNRLGICSGDSGGPLLDADNLQVGVASYVLGGCDSIYPDVYAEVAAAYDWIDENLCKVSPHCTKSIFQRVGYKFKFLYLYFANFVFLY